MRTTLPLLRQRSQVVILLLSLTANLIVTGLFLRYNTAPPRWDEALYLQHSESVFNALHGIKSYNYSYLDILHYGRLRYPFVMYFHLLGGSHAPLIALLPLPGYFLFGPGFPGVTATLFALIVLFHLLLYRLAGMLTDPPTALLAVLITSTMPLTVGMSRVWMVEYGLTILVMAWMYLQLRSENFSQGRFNLALGTVLGLGMLMKITFPVYVGGAALWGVSRAWGERQKFGRVLRNGLISLGVGGVIMGSWYIPNIRSVLAFALNAGFGAAAQNYSLGSPAFIEELLSYWRNVINFGVSFYYFALLVLFAAAAGVIRLLSRKLPRAGLRLDGWQAMLAWFVVPFCVFSLGVNKDFRFLLPALPPLSLWLAWLIRSVLRGRGAIWIPGLLVFPYFLFVFTSLPFPNNSFLRMGPFVALAPDMAYMARPVAQTWPLETVLAEIESDAQQAGALNEPDLPVWIGVAPNHAYLNMNNLGYYAALHRLPFNFELFLPPTAEDWEAQKDRIRLKEYIIAKTGDAGPEFAHNPLLTPALLAGELPFVEIARFALPDGTEVILYKKN